jgi:predicted ATP-grasp superfamily ATP-dependent carboligase
MRVFVYEFMTGGGLWSLDPPTPPSASLLREGMAMLCAVAEDFTRIRGCEVLLLLDRRIRTALLPACQVLEIGSAASEMPALTHCAAEADWTLLIAPEFDSHLLRRCRHVEDAGGRLLSPDSDVVALASDKSRTAEFLAAAGVPTPLARMLPAAEQLPRGFPYPAVLKPLDGAGSLGVRLVRRAEDPISRDRSSALRLEQFCPGLAASVAVLCGPRVRLPLEPCAQHLSTDGCFRYLGGSLPLPEPWRSRASRLARRVAACLPDTHGYVGMDMVLGEGGEESDYVIELNPRLTTSYLGLRQVVRGNLAEAMLRAAAGERPSLLFARQPIEFSAGAERDASLTILGD